MCGMPVEPPVSIFQQGCLKKRTFSLGHTLQATAASWAGDGKVSSLGVEKAPIKRPGSARGGCSRGDSFEADAIHASGLALTPE